LLRGIILIITSVNNKSIILEKPTTDTKWLYQTLSLIPTLLFYTSLTFICWFFAQNIYLRNIYIKSKITPFYIILNIILYIINIILGIILLSYIYKYMYIYIYILILFYFIIYFYSFIRF